MRLMSKRKTIGIFTTMEGHLSITDAIEETLKNQYRTKRFIGDIPFTKAWIALYQFFPKLGQVPYRVMSKQKSNEYINKILKIKFQQKINKFFTKHHLSLLINTHGGFNSSLEHIQDVSGAPFINVLSDPLTLYPVIISQQAKTNLTFDQKTNSYCREYYPQAKYQATGWFVRSRFEEDYDKKKIRKKLKLDADTLTFLIASGSEGTNLIMKVLPSLMFSSKPVQVIVACGSNQALYKSIQALQSLLDKNEKSNFIIPLKFTPNIHLYMQAADLVIGKAGPNTLFESVATQTPFFAITHISGQEDGNLEIIKEYNLGYVEENLLKIQKLLKKIIKQPEDLESFKKDVLKMKVYNQQAKEKLKKIVSDLI